MARDEPESTRSISGLSTPEGQLKQGKLALPNARPENGYIPMGKVDLQRFTRAGARSPRDASDTGAIATISILESARRISSISAGLYLTPPGLITSLISCRIYPLGRLTPDIWTTGFRVTLAVVLLCRCLANPPNRSIVRWHRPVAAQSKSAGFGQRLDSCIVPDAAHGIVLF